MGNFNSVIRSSAVVTGGSRKTGIIRGISNDFCVVSVNVDGSLQSLSFKKTAFYFWGYSCEGDMTNLLDVGMEVNVRIRIHESRKPTVVAAWIGDEPECINEALVAVFNEKGFVDGIVDDGAAVIFGENIGDFVIAKKGIIYRDRCLLDATAAPLSLDEPVTFDAIPLEVEHHSGATYEATCAWTGAEPRLVDRFDLRVLESLDEKMLSGDMNRVRGVVVVIPNDAVAIAEIEDTKEKILVFRSSFGQGFESIHDVVGIGDRLCIHLASAYMLGCRRLLFATKARKDGEGIEVSLTVATPPPLVPAQLEPKSAIRCASEEAPLKSPHILEEREREISGDTNRSTVEDRIGEVSGPSAAEVDSRVVTNGFLTEHRIKSSASSISPSEKRVDMNGSTVQMRDRSANTNGLSLEKQDGRVDSNRSSADEGNGKAGTNDFPAVEWDRRLQANGSSVEGTDTRADTNGPLTAERDRSLQKNVSPDKPVTKAGPNGFSAESRDSHLSINGLTERCESVVTNGSSAETRDLKELPMSFDLDGTALCREPPLIGTIHTKTTLQGQDEAVIRYDGRYIYVNICDVYVDGRSCSKDQFSSLVKLGDSVVNFEAVAYELSSGKTHFSHYATCVWVGEKPSLSVVASSIWDVNHSILRFGNRTYVGKVENFCFPDIALLSIEAGKGKLLSVVCLHLSELVQKQVKQSRKNSSPNCISDFVEFQGYVEFKVKRNDMCSLGLCAYNVKKSTMLAASKSSVLCENLLRELICADSRSTKQCEESEFQCAPTSQKSDSFGLEVVRNVTTFSPSISLARRSYFLNGVGTFCFDQKSQVAKIEHIFGSSILESDEYQSFRDSSGLKFGFDAEIVQSSASNELCVKKVWKPDSLKSASDGILATELTQTKLASFDESLVYRLVIASIPFHDCAIAECGGTKVYVPLDSIVTSPKADPILCSIELFLAVGDPVGLKVKEERSSTQTLLKATACYKLDAEIENMAVNQMSWRDVWGLGEYFKTGRVREKKGTYSVDFVSTKIPGTEVSLQLSKSFDCGRLFVDGKPLSGSMSCLKDRDISFHVACHPVGSFFAPHIEWAWLGNYPLLPTLLKNRTAATCGLICQDWLYEGIVRDFPLPTHAICQVGFLSVLLPLTAEKKDGDIVGVAESHLKEGDRVILSIKEQFCVKQAILISSLCRSVATMFGESEVLINVLGKVINLPRPRGTINAQGFPFDVWFDRSVVFAVNGVSKKADIFEWIEYIDASISVGTEVYFSAAKDLTWNKCRIGYRVYEMRVGNAPEQV